MKALFFKLFLIILILYAPLKLLIHLLIHNAWVNVIDLAIESLIFSIMFTSFQWLIFYNTIKPKLSFLKSESPIKKQFDYIKEKENIIAEKFDIDDFIKALEKDFIVTYKSNTIIKVRDKYRLFKSISGATIQIDKENNHLKINAFPLIGGYKKGDQQANKMVKKIKGLIYATISFSTNLKT